MPDKYTDDVKERFDSLVQIYDEIIYPKWEYTNLNKRILIHCVESVKIDLSRASIFHNIAHADRHKQAGYSMKWITKLRPIQIDSEKRDIYTLLNEFYAAYVGVSNLEDVSFNDLSEKCLRNLLYTLHFRELSGSLLSFVAYTIERSKYFMNHPSGGEI